MNCDIVRENMSLYIDNELDENTKMQFEEHLKTCVFCKEDLDILICAVDVMADMTEELPDGFSDRLHEKLADVKVQKRSFIKPLYLKTLSAVAAALVIVFIARGIFYDPAGQNMTTSSAMKEDAFESEKSADDYGIMAAKEEPDHDAAPSLATRSFTAMAGANELEADAKYLLDIDEDITSIDEINEVLSNYSIAISVEDTGDEKTQSFIYINESIYTDSFPEIEKKFSDLGYLFEYEEPDFNDRQRIFKIYIKKSK